MKSIPNGMMSRNPAGSGDHGLSGLKTPGTNGHNAPPALPKVSFISHIRGYPAGGGDFEFHSPPEAPIFRPTEEEFAAGPLDYIARIKSIAEPHGICKIIPPPVSSCPCTNFHRCINFLSLYQFFYSCTNFGRCINFHRCINFLIIVSILFLCFCSPSNHPLLWMWISFDSLLGFKD